LLVPDYHLKMKLCSYVMIMFNLIKNKISIIIKHNF
jgi:hypothetical protein